MGVKARKWIQSQKKNISSRIFLGAFLSIISPILFFHPGAYSGETTLKWDPSRASVAGYRVYYGRESGKYNGHIDAGKTTECTIVGLEDGQEYYFAATAYDLSGVESGYSNEVKFSPSTYYELYLSAGWNLISLPLQPFDPSIEKVLRDILTSVYFVTAFHNGGAVSYFPGNLGGSTLKTIEAGVGYWIQMMAPGTLKMAGTSPPQSIQLLRGSNLVGYSSTAAAVPSVALRSIADKVASVRTYENGQWKVYYPNYPAGTNLYQLNPGSGYYIEVTQDATWNIP